MEHDIGQIVARLRVTAALELRPYTGAPSDFELREDGLILTGYTAALEAIERELGLT